MKRNNHSKERKMKRVLILMVFMSIALLWIPLSSHADNEFHGVIDSRPEGKVGTGVIGGRQVVVTERTELKEKDGPLVVGACAEVDYEGNFVEEIESEQKSKCGK
jgi:hypothetical protein